MMKKLFLTLIVLALSVFVLASCNNGGNGEGNQNQNNQQACPHSEVIEIPETNSTCSKVGYTAGQVCKACNAYVVTPVAKELLPHRPQKIAAVEATCLTSGSTEGARCVMCREFTTPTKVIPALNHIIDGESKIVDSPAIEATCTEAGYTGGKHCSVCYTITENPTIAPPLSHIEKTTADAVAPTCQADGCTVEISCDRCKDVLVESVAIPKGEEYHDYEWVVDSTDATKENGTCKVVGCTSTAVRDVVAEETPDNDEGDENT